MQQTKWKGLRGANMKTKQNTLAIGNKMTWLMSKFGIYIAFFALCTFFSVFSPVFLTTKNMINLVRQVAFNAILSMGMTMVIITGGIDLSVGSVLALTSVVTASFVKVSAPVLPVYAAILVGLGIGAMCGLFNGIVVSKGKLAPFIVTMVMMTAARGAAQLYTKGRPVSGLAETLTFLGTGSLMGLPVPVWILSVVVIVTYFILNWTKLGRYIYAVGGNEQAARASGIKVDRVKIFVYMYSGIMAALVGIVMMARLNSASPILGEGYETDAIAASVIGGTSMTGGRGKVFSVLIGALIIGTISNGLDILNVSSYWQQIIKAAIILIAVLMDKRSAD